MDKGKIIFDILNDYVYNDENQAGVKLQVINANDLPKIIPEIVKKLNKPKEMKASELRIGNFIYCGDEETKIYPEDFEMIDDCFFEWNPIPLTKEWLLKFGFEEDSCNYYKIIENKEAVLYIDKLDTTFAYGYPYECSGGDLKLKYVHQLQNLYHALTGNELEINKK